MSKSRDMSQLNSPLGKPAEGFINPFGSAVRGNLPSQVTTSFDGASLSRVPIGQLMPYHREEFEWGEQNAAVFYDYSAEKFLRLKASIREHGVLEPITVYRSDRNADTPYEILAGKHRWMAVTELHKENPDEPKWKNITAIVKTKQEMEANDFAEADLIFTTTNTERRDEMKESERAAVCRMIASAYQHQGKCDTDMEQTRYLVERKTGFKKDKVILYMRLSPANVMFEFVRLVDSKKLSFTGVAKYLCSLTKDNQELLLNWAADKAKAKNSSLDDYLHENLTVQSMRQIMQRQKQLQGIETNQKGDLTVEDLEEIIVTKGAEPSAITVTAVKRILPHAYWKRSPKEIEEYLAKAVAEYEENHSG